MTNPAPKTSRAVHGVDGCRGGWLAATLQLDCDGRSAGLSFALHHCFADCLAAARNDLIAVDIPIGLLDDPIPGGRPCDRIARSMLGWPRRNSVFSPSARPALGAASYREAIRRNGQGMSQEAFRIMPKIREVDEVLMPADQARVYEGHPELAFMRLAGAPIIEPKRKDAGRRRRLALLESNLGLAIDLDDIRDSLGRQIVAADDVLDATALTLTARAIRNCTARRAGDGQRDARGVEMAIWY